MDSVKIFDIKTDALEKQVVIDRIIDALDNGEKLTITYATASTYHMTFSNMIFSNTINTFDIVYPDGVGTYLALNLLTRVNLKKKKYLDEIYKKDLLTIFNKRRTSIFLLGDKFNVVTKATARIKMNYPKIRIAGMQSGFNFNEEHVIEKINKSKAEFLFLGMGNPLQEEFVFRNKNKLNCKVFFCLGGGFQVLAGIRKAEDNLIRKMHLEWLYRIYIQPTLIFRYLIGIPVFSWKVFIERYRIEESLRS